MLLAADAPMESNTAKGWSWALTFLLTAVASAAMLSSQVRVVEPPVTTPASFILHESAFDTANGRALSYDWRDGSLLAAASGTANWVRLPAAPNQPSVRLGALMVFDERRNRLVLFGGLSLAAHTQVDETWEFDSTRWHLRATATRPPARYGARGCYRADRGTVLMFGGFTTTDAGTVPLDDTWEYDGTDWRLVATGGLPVSTTAFATDLARGTVVAYSGLATHELRATGWTVVQPTQSPPNRIAPGLAYDPRRRRCVMFGGRDPVTRLQLRDFWEYDGVTWVQRNPVPAPVRPRYAAQMHYDPTARAVLAIGGSLQLGDLIRPLADVMRYEPTVAAESLAFGVGCPGRDDIPALTTSQLPWLGRTIQLQIPLPPGSLAFFVGGASNTVSAGPVAHTVRAAGVSATRQHPSPGDGHR